MSEFDPNPLPEDSLETWTTQQEGRLVLTLTNNENGDMRVLDIGLTELGLRASIGHESILTWEWSSMDDEGNVSRGMCNLRVRDVTHDE